MVVLLPLPAAWSPYHHRSSQRRWAATVARQRGMALTFARPSGFMKAFQVDGTVVLADGTPARAGGKAGHRAGSGRLTHRAAAGPAQAAALRMQPAPCT